MIHNAELQQMPRSAQKQIPDRSRARVGRSDYLRVEIHLPNRLIHPLTHEAARYGIPRAHWIVALIAHRLGGAPRFLRDDELALFQVATELRRIRSLLAVSLRDIQALDGAGMEEMEIVLADLRETVGVQMETVRRAFAGNLDYWRSEP